MRSAPGSTGVSALGRPLLAWTLAALPLLAGGRAAESLGEASRLALVWIPWLALIGWPGRREGGRRWPLCLGLALPQLALAARLDRELGFEVSQLLATFLAGLLAAAALGEARDCARGRAAGWYGGLWFLLVPVAPALAAAWGWAGDGVLAGEGVASWLARLSPLGSTWGDLRSGAEEGWVDALLRPSVLACVGLWILVVVFERAGEEES